MCGLVGVFTPDGADAPSEAPLRAGISELSHRGPDAVGVFTAPGIGLAHARLALVDLDPRSNQPFADATGRYVLVYNGEIYNFLALRQELQAMGTVFRTQSDTEVVLEALIRWPAREALRRFEGMFAFAFYDRQTRQLLLARDRFGMKPMFYGGTGTADAPFVFASGPAALRPWIAFEPDPYTLMAFLMGHGGPMQGPAFQARISALQPGFMAEIGPDQPLQMTEFFRLEEFVDANESERLARLSPTQLVDETEERLLASTRAHLFADAQIGAFCSGGVDSSILAAMAVRENRNVVLFHADVRGRWSERQAAEALARYLKLELHVVPVEDQDFIDLVPEVTRHYGHPFSYHPNCPPMMMVAGLARDQGIKGLLSGEGSDELYLGYPWLGRKGITDAVDSMRNLLVRAVRGVPELGPILLPDPAPNFATVMGMLSRRERASDMADIAGAVAALPTRPARRSAAMSLEWMKHHLRTLLHRNDTMGMSRSIEARFPFLDHQLVRSAVNMPMSAKLRFSPSVLEKAHPFVRDKWVVREVAKRYLPPELSQRVKLGFWTTVFERFSVDPAYFDDSPLVDMLRLSRRDLTTLMQGAPRNLATRMIHSDVWLRVAHGGDADGAIKSRLRRYGRISVETGRPVAPLHAKT